ncbi:MAG: hypothetical protein ACI3V0_07570, partial [Faecousia sp.]
AHTTFVALDIFGGSFMGLLCLFRLFSECFDIAGVSGLIDCTKYLFSVLRRPDLDPRSLAFQVSYSD